MSLAIFAAGGAQARLPTGAGGQHGAAAAWAGRCLLLLEAALQLNWKRARKKVSAVRLNRALKKILSLRSLCIHCKRAGAHLPYLSGERAQGAEGLRNLKP